MHITGFTIIFLLAALYTLLFYMTHPSKRLWRGKHKLFWWGYALGHTLLFVGLAIFVSFLYFDPFEY